MALQGGLLFCQSLPITSVGNPARQSAGKPFPCRPRFPSKQPHAVADRRALRNGSDCTIIEMKKQALRPPGNLPGGVNQDIREEGNGRG